jgi:hypothetical protein
MQSLGVGARVNLVDWQAVLKDCDDQRAFAETDVKWLVWVIVEQRSTSVFVPHEWLNFAHRNHSSIELCDERGCLAPSRADASQFFEFLLGHLKLILWQQLPSQRRFRPA